MALTAEQRFFFDSFGYLVVPGLLADEIEWITSEFYAVFDARGGEHDGSIRSVIVPFIDQRERLCTLLDNPKVVDTIGSLLGEDFNYVGGDGNIHTGNTPWHTDGGHQVGLYAKFHIYLDSLTRESGALRVIPGSHLYGPWRDQLHKVFESNDRLNMDNREVPCVAIETDPGDVVVANHNLYPAAFGGGQARRHAALNVTSRATTPQEIAELDQYIPRHCLRKGDGQVHSNLMRSSASPARMRHLEQPIEREALLVKAKSAN